MDYLGKLLCITIMFLSCFAMQASACHRGLGITKAMKGHKGANIRDRKQDNSYALNVFRFSETILYPVYSTTTSLYKCKAVTAQKFILHEYPMIAEQASQGQGEYINLLAQIMNCPVEVYPEFNMMMQNNFEVLFNSSDTKPELFLELLSKMILKTPPLNNKCGLFESVS